MIDIMLTGHGKFPSGLLEAVEMIMGPQEAVTVMELHPGDGLESFRDKFLAALEQYKVPENVLILADLPGGTPANVGSLLSLQKGATCIAGVNLPMALEAFSGRHEGNMEYTSGKALAAGKAMVRNLTSELTAKQ